MAAEPALDLIGPGIHGLPASTSSGLRCATSGLRASSAYANVIRGHCVNAADAYCGITGTTILVWRMC
jgi:hypothetical protein